MRRAPRLLNPLLQRLYLYRFAYVQVDPGDPVSLTRWGIEGAQLAAVGAGRSGWRGLFAACAPFSPVCSAPAISPSPALLRRIRRRQPLRPLILCRTAFEGFQNAPKLRPLVQPLAKALDLTAPDDGVRPLFRLRAWPGPAGAPAEAFRRFPDHPRRVWARLCVRLNPTSSFWRQEDGLVAEQLDLFNPAPRRLTPAALARDQRTFDAVFLAQFAGLEQSRWVFAADPALLCWFRCDCARLTSPRIPCWDFPLTPDPRAPRPGFVLAGDADIRFARLSAAFPTIHLDGGPRQWRYRAARQAPAGQRGWLTDAAPRAVARIMINRRRLVFWRTDQGWISAPAAIGASGEVPDQSDFFADRFESLRLLARPNRSRQR